MAMGKVPGGWLAGSKVLGGELMDWGKVQGGWMAGGRLASDHVRGEVTGREGALLSVVSSDGMWEG